MARTMTVDLGDELREFIESLIESGDLPAPKAKSDP